jgi:clan AA aspartic protease
MKIEGSFDGSLTPRIVLPIADNPVSIVVDTGFNGELMLPRALINRLEFQFGMKSEAELADGSVVETSIYRGKILWFGKERTVQAVATDSEDALLGTEMLFGVTLFMDLDANQVTLEQKT